jgi:hypothetical protein
MTERKVRRKELKEKHACIPAPESTADLRMVMGTMRGAAGVTASAATARLLLLLLLRLPPALLLLLSCSCS